MKNIIKPLLLICVISINLTYAKAQAPNWSWAKSAGGTNADYGKSLVNDKWGNTYVTGSFSSKTLVIKDSQFNKGSSDAFLEKYDSVGNAVWGRSAGGTDADAPYDIAMDDSGYIYITGAFNSAKMSFGKDTLYNSASGTSDIFIVKLDTAGNLKWVKKFGGDDIDEGRSITTDAKGNVFITGGFRSSTISFGSSKLTKVGTGTIYIAKLDRNGNVLWAKSAGGSSYQEGNGIITDTAGNAYITGMFRSSTVSFGSKSISNNSATESDIFIAGYSASGTELWAKSGGGTGFDESEDITIDSKGNLYITGVFKGATATFGSKSVSNFSTGNTDIFIVKYDVSGNAIWAKSAGGNKEDYGQSIVADVYGNTYITGEFQSSTLAFGSTTLTNAGGQDSYIASYDKDGNTRWAKLIGGANNEKGFGISINQYASIFVTGSFSSKTLPLGKDTLKSSGTDDDIFIVKTDAQVITVFLEPTPAIPNISFYPNPFSTATTLVLGDALLQSALQPTVIIYDVLGRQVRSLTLTNTTTIIEKSDLPAGVYFATIQYGNGIVARGKMVIE